MREYIYGTIQLNGKMIENLKTIGSTHTNYSGFISTRREFADGVIIEDRCRILQKYYATEADGCCYDWYLIDNHIRYMDTIHIVNGLTEIQQELGNLWSEQAAAIREGVNEVE